MPASTPAPRTYRYYDFILGAFVCVLLCSNLIGPAKVATAHLPLIGDFSFGAGVLFFPISYVFGDILTEVYGYARARRVIWSGLTALVFASVMATVVVKLPPAAGWHGQEAYESIFGQTPRIVFASITAFFLGEFVNSYTLAKMKLWTNGNALWSRIIGSTIAGEGVDCLVFYPIAFFGVWETRLVLSVMVSNYVMKVVWEILATPLTYRLIAALKRAENEDYYDRNTQFTPFTLRT
ncbi:MAG: queuosine precursor transporter [Proteobacteria bacterium]|uniref:queuosine precursor transporter n=1 Tax=Rudaea sp. TaxID=2136325 RepID=UPI001DDD9F3A|nr:queuosine precursor transporter [Pseudomonadota bacterium]MBS0568350.1 queuosine precursor transporter [Pseudomonadota bacterium]